MCVVCRDPLGCQFTVISGSPVGVSSQTAGNIEMMLHRLTTVDDDKGLGFPLNDTSVVGG